MFSVSIDRWCGPTIPYPFWPAVRTVKSSSSGTERGPSSVTFPMAGPRFEHAVFIPDPLHKQARSQKPREQPGPFVLETRSLSEGRRSYATTYESPGDGISELLQLLRVLLTDLKVVIEGPQRVEQSVLAMCQLVVMEVGIGELEGQEVGATIVQRNAHAQQLPLQDSGRGDPEATDVAGVGGANGVEEGVENADSICLSESLATAKGEDVHGLIA
ncbi:uncharacterized protein PG986_009672 [Apiospora aurea]|uniref:Uncharacterized protein n=1 Tax=Apiospora aurea TaxID=335848 RepID=A0ABR1Q8C6_9PEZI